MLQAQLGDGTSLKGTTGVPGLSFDYTDAAGAGGGLMLRAPSCSGRWTGTDGANPGFTDQTHRVDHCVVGDDRSRDEDQARRDLFADSSCRPTTPVAVAGHAASQGFGVKVSGIASCASTTAARNADGTKANAFALSGKLSITMNELDSLGKNVKAQGYVAVSFDPASTDVLKFTGLITKGASVGATVTGSLFLDAVSKISPAPKPPVGNGYQFDATTAGHCTDGDAEQHVDVASPTRQRHVAARHDRRLRPVVRLPGGVVAIGHGQLRGVGYRYERGVAAAVS